MNVFTKMQKYPLSFPPDNPKVPKVLNTESMQLPAGNPAPEYGPPGGYYGGCTGNGFNSFTGQPCTPQQQGEPHPHPLPPAQLAWQPRRSTFVPVLHITIICTTSLIADTAGTAYDTYVAHTAQLLHVQKRAQSPCLGYIFGGWLAMTRAAKLRI